MSDQLQRIEVKIDRILDDISALKESRGSLKSRIEGHATQLGLLWTLLILSIGGIVAAYFKG